MATAEIEKGENSAEIIGYAEPWIVAPGDSVAIKVRQTPHFITRLVANALSRNARLRHSIL